MRVRGSRGVCRFAFHGNFFVRSMGLLALPAVPMDQLYAIELLITSSRGRQMQMVMAALPTTSSIADLYATAAPIAIATLFGQ
ncbi:hypothetical protein KEM48_002167 [Puccinia striiformis f. sp. tritici PST-130]|nr:hypothetical protein KEM48_002167 [Puccinia striiformis f. sp. tritici PST-130]